MRLLFALVVLLHGSIHLLGFVGELSLTKIEGITPSTLPPPWRQVLGVCWLLVTLLFLGAFATFLLRWPSWWMLGLPAVVFSQLLIFIYWSDAKVGTLANLIMIVPVLLALGASRFDARVDREVLSLFEGANGSTATVTESDLEALPAPVSRWLERTGVIGASRVRTTRLKQSGLMRTEPEGAWLPAEARQYFSIDPPAFSWRVHVTMMKVLPIEGRDAYVDGRGHMLITLGGLVPFVDGRGDEIDQGTLLRFLGEIMWTPTAALTPFVEWAPIDATHARATMRHGGISADGIFSFDEEGRMVSMEARRFMGSGKGAVLTDWFAEVTAWQRFHGIELPSEGQVSWRLPEGEFTYDQWTITELDFDPPGPYPH